jgi:hypothetical protein
MAGVVEAVGRDRSTTMWEAEAVDTGTQRKTTSTQWMAEAVVDSRVSRRTRRTFRWGH